MSLAYPRSAEEGGIISSFKWFFPAVATCKGSGVWGRHPVLHPNFHTWLSLFTQRMGKPKIYWWSIVNWAAELNSKLPIIEYPLLKKVREIRKDQCKVILEETVPHIWHISSYIMQYFLKYDVAPDLLKISFFVRKAFPSLFKQCCKQSVTGFFLWKEPTSKCSCM